MKQPLQKRQDWIKGRRQKRKLARRARLRRQVLRYTLLAVLVGLGTFGLRYLPWSIKDASNDIHVHGNRVATDEQIRDAISKSSVGRPLYKVDPAELQKSVCALPIVKYSFVHRTVFPHPAINVEVMEEFPWACLTNDPEQPATLVVAQSGRLIPIAEFPSVIQPPLRICGGEELKLSSAQIAQWDGWVRLISEQLGQPVTLIDMRQPNKLIVQCANVELHVGQADSTLTRRLGRLASVLPVAYGLKGKLEYIDLSLDSNVPLKVDKSADPTTKDDELLRQAVRALASNQTVPQP